MSIKEWKKQGSFFLFKDRYKVFTIHIGDQEASADDTLLLIHGFPESSYSFHKVIPELSRGFKRIIVLDMIGYGFSDKPIDYSYSLLDQADLVLAAWKEHNVKGGHVIAHDMGNSVATELLARHEDNSLPIELSKGILSLTLTNGSVVLSLSKLRIIQKLLLKPYGKYISRLTSFKIFNHQVKSAHGNDDLTNEDIQNLWGLNLLLDGHKKSYLTIRYINDRKKYEKSRWLPALQKTNVPIHICWGDQDNVARVEMAHHLKENICPDAHLTIMEGVGHFCQISNPRVWVNSVLPIYTKEG